jgi:hypothetical protein
MKFHKIRPLGVMVFLAEGQPDGHDEHNDNSSLNGLRTRLGNTKKQTQSGLKYLKLVTAYLFSSGV